MKNVIYSEGNCIKSVCYHCKTVNNSKFQFRDMSMCDGRFTLKGVLVSVCDNCNNITGIPEQSTSTINEQMNSFQQYEYVYTM